MPTKVCSVCNQLQRLSASEFRYTDRSGGDHVCSKKCVFDWVRSHKKVEDLTKMCGVTNGDVIHTQGFGSRGESYSVKLDRWFRSNYECFFAEEGAGKFRMAYESWVFHWVKDNGSNAIYVPDFYFADYGCFVEVKGAWRDGSRAKMVAFRKEFPNVPVVVLSWVVSKEFYGEGIKE